MKNWLSFILFLLVSSTGNAEKRPLNLELDTSTFYEDSKDASWMRDENYQSSEEQFSNNCEGMSKEIAALKGKPQRRFALEQRYEAECLKQEKE
jgi:hypothetical protein